MTTVPDELPMTIPGRDAAGRMFDVLEKAGFTGAAPLQLTDISEADVGAGPRTPRRVAVGLRRTVRAGALETLTRLFLIGASVPTEQAEQALAPTPLDLWTDAGLLVEAARHVTAPVQLAPVQGRLFVADARREGRVRPDHVMGYCGSTATLAKVTIRRQIGAMLDLGTGCGIHALLAAAHAEQVVGTDLNPRATNMAAFNARLNGLDNVAMLTGNLFAPVQGRRFDLIVANPPFVISPETAFIYRDAGRSGDELLHDILREAPQFLNEGGYCQLMCEWAHRRGLDWRERLADWTRGSGCDAWILQANTTSATLHAETWAGGDEAEAAQPWAARMDRWLAYYQQLGIESISNGLILLRRRSAGPNWFFVDTAPKVGGNVGAAIERGFAVRDWLARQPDEALLQARLVIGPETRWQQTLALAEGIWSIRDSNLSIREGLQFQRPANPYLASLLDGCRGAKTLAETLATVQATTSGGPDRATALCLVRALVAHGFLAPS